MRERVKEHLPSVVLTLLSIVQALALELLWSRIQDAEHLDQMSWYAAITWAQLGAVFLGIVVIWVVYASSAMRFRWVPSTSDSIYPFVIGVLEFVLVETASPDRMGAWLLGMGAIFAIMNWVTHDTFRRARREPDNAQFFSRVGPATLRDFYGAFVTVSMLVALGVYFLLAEPANLPRLMVAVGVILLLLAQLNNARVFWERSLGRPEGDAADAAES